MIGTSFQIFRKYLADSLCGFLSLLVCYFQNQNEPYFSRYLSTLYGDNGYAKTHLAQRGSFDNMSTTPK